MEVAGAVYFPKDAHFTPDRYLAALQSQCEKLGVHFKWDTEVTGLETERGTITAVETLHGEFLADEVVLCGGSWSPQLVCELGLKIPIQAGKGYSLTLPRPRELPQLCSIFTEARMAVTPMGSSLRFGGTMEIAGLNEDINLVRVRGIIKSVPAYFPKFTPADFAGIQPWRGLRPCSPDGLPYLGRTAKFSNLILATGHAMILEIKTHAANSLESNNTTCPDVAPNTFRMPISFVRCSATNAAKPNRPIQAIKIATEEKITDTMFVFCSAT